MKVLVIGWYSKNNLGDELFKEAFKHLFPSHKFEFTDVITAETLRDVSAVFFGGGSFLYAQPDITPEALSIMKTLPIFYVGIGIETDIHPLHQELMRQAKLVATRSPTLLQKALDINANSIVIPDIVYSLQSSISPTKFDKSILIIPNIEVVPQNFDPHWKYCAWAYFKSEFSQFLDHVAQDHTVNFFSMCQNEKINDRWAAVELISSMKHRSSKYIINDPLNTDVKFITEMFSKYNVIISQRYHGSVLAEMSGVPCITLSHHDKLNAFGGINLSYYNTSQSSLMSALDKIQSQKTLLNNSESFENLVSRIDIFLENNDNIHRGG